MDGNQKGKNNKNRNQLEKDSKFLISNKCKKNRK